MSKKRPTGGVVTSARFEAWLTTLRRRAEDATRQAIGPFQGVVLPVINPLPEEIAKRIVMNALLVSRRALRDEVLVILADYCDHAWSKGAFDNERKRMQLADLILGPHLRRAARPEGR